MANIETPKFPCPQCRYNCDSNTSCILCAHCSNMYHLKCTTLTKKKFSSIRRGIGMFKCKMCIKKLKCTSCSKQSNSPHREGLYCVNCLDYHCKRCLPLSNEQFSEYLNTKKPFLCFDCSAQHVCPICSELCQNHPDAESSIYCDSCKLWIHHKCTKINVRQFKKLGKSSDPYFCTNCVNKNLPFTTKAGNDFFKEQLENTHTLPPENSLCQLCIECQTDCENCASCIDQFRVCDECINCNTLDMKSFSQMMNNNEKNTISFVHFNIRSARKNFHSIEEFLYSLDKTPDVICVSETKLNQDPSTDDDSSTDDIMLDGYHFFDTKSASNYGGTGVYISDKYFGNATLRKDLEINIPGECEASFVEIKCVNGKNKSNPSKNIIVGAIYRHPHDNYDEFFDKLSETVAKINKKCPLFLLGDTNINVSVNNAIVRQFKNTLLAFGLRNFTSHSTRITSTSETTIDHFITNQNCNQIKSGVIQFEAADHLPIFGVANLCLPKTHLPQPSFKRMFDINKKQQFCNSLQQNILSNPIIIDDNFDPNIAMGSLVETINSTYNSTFPMRKISKCYRKKQRKPWITALILNLIKTKHKLYKNILTKGTNKVLKVIKDNGIL